MAIKTVPVSYQDCITFINNHRDEIKAGDYELILNSQWLRSFNDSDLILFIDDSIFSYESLRQIARRAESDRVTHHLAHKNSDYHEEIAANTNTSSATLDYLISISSRSHLMAIIAQHKNLTDAAMMSLSENNNETVRAIIGGRLIAPHNKFEFLTRDESIKVRCAVARNEKISAALMEFLAKDTATEVRETLAANSRLTVATQEILAIDSYVKVQQSLLDNHVLAHSVLSFMSSTSLCKVKTVIAANPQTPIDCLNILSKDESFTVRYYVAENSSTPFEILKTLAKCADNDVKQAALQNKNYKAASLLNRALNQF